MTSLGMVTLRKGDGSEPQAKVLSEGGGTTSDGTAFDASYSVNGSNADRLGCLQCRSLNFATKVISLFNYTHSQGLNKQHMGSVFHSCIVAEHRTKKTREILVEAAGSHWEYMSWGFEPISDPVLKDRWRFIGSSGILHSIKNDRPLSPLDQSNFNAQRALLAEGLGVREEDLTPERVCISEDLAEEMLAIFRRATALKRPAPSIRFPSTKMRMSPEGIKKGEQRILASTLQFDKALVNTLQEELLEEYAAQKRMPERVASLIYDFVGKV